MDDTLGTERDIFDPSPSKHKQFGSDIGDPVEGEKECKKSNKTLRPQVVTKKTLMQDMGIIFPMSAKSVTKGLPVGVGIKCIN